MHQIFNTLPDTTLDPQVFDDRRALMHTPALRVSDDALIPRRVVMFLSASAAASGSSAPGESIGTGPLRSALQIQKAGHGVEMASPSSRRAWLKAAAALAAGCALPASAQLVFSPEDDTAGKTVSQETPTVAESTALHRQSVKGYIPPDFWSRPRELWLRRQGTKDEVRAVYWKDGRVQSEGYWRICALLRDVRANLMTVMDPLILDILRGIYGFYQAWQHPHPIVVTSGYRTHVTNAALSKEGAAKNSMHLYGKAVDLYIPGIPAKDISALGVYLKLGGVGFYPSKGFTHLDTGKRRVWKG